MPGEFTIRVIFKRDIIVGNFSQVRTPPTANIPGPAIFTFWFAVDMVFHETGGDGVVKGAVVYIAHDVVFKAYEFITGVQTTVRGRGQGPASGGAAVPAPTLFVYFLQGLKEITQYNELSLQQPFFIKLRDFIELMLYYFEVFPVDDPGLVPAGGRFQVDHAESHVIQVRYGLTAKERFFGYGGPGMNGLGVVEQPGFVQPLAHGLIRPPTVFKFPGPVVGTLVAVDTDADAETVLL
jgi:hypothetical protein